MKSENLKNFTLKYCYSDSKGELKKVLNSFCKESNDKIRSPSNQAHEGITSSKKL